VSAQNLKISKLYYAVDGTREPFEALFSADDFVALPLTGPIAVKGELMRVEEGIMLLMHELEATQMGNCGFCEKPLKQALQFHPSEWLYHEEKPLDYDDSDEALFLDKKQLELDPYEPVRQELILHIDPAPHCPKTCKEFAEPERGVKALSKLKEIL
jgi:uncharacterized metal-binding protein YceD (DUF177 family)